MRASAEALDPRETRARDPVSDPLLRGDRHVDRVTGDDQCRQVYPRNERAPVVRRDIEDEVGGVPPVEHRDLIGQPGQPLG